MCCRIGGGRSNVADDVEESLFIKAERRKEVSGSCEEEGVGEEGEGVGVARSREGEEEVENEEALEAGEVGVRIVVVVDVVVVGCIH